MKTTLTVILSLVPSLAYAAEQGDPARGFLYLFILIIGYLLPGFVATSREHKSAAAIWATVILFGWTGLGWGIALIWSLTGNVGSKTVEV